jgi:GNAT superfamily N-acetyltransferase
VAPPSPRHTTWVATEGDDDRERVVGAAALSPAVDPDLDPTDWLELLVLAVDPEHRSAGHGSRLLNAAMEEAAAAGESGAVVWLTTGDDVARRFLESAGWTADGAHRELSNDIDSASLDDAVGNGGHGAPGEQSLRQVRLATVLAPVPSA